MAIGKHIHPTRYRQIIETVSAASISLEEQDLVSQDQKHTSNVARIHYRKRRLRDVVEEGDECVKKLRGESGKQLDIWLGDLVGGSKEGEESDSDSDIFITHNKFIDEKENEGGDKPTDKDANSIVKEAKLFRDKRIQ